MSTSSDGESSGSVKTFRAGFPRILMLVILFSTLVLAWVFGRFNTVSSASLAADLWIVVDDYVRPSGMVLVDASSRNPVTGELSELKDLTLEIYRADTLWASIPVLGALRYGFAMPSHGDVLLRMSYEDPHIGEIFVERRVRPLRAGESTRRAVSSTSRSGNHYLERVTEGGTCGWKVEAQVMGGAAVSRASNWLLVRVSDAEGRGVGGVPLTLWERGEKARATTDRDGVGRLPFSVEALSFLEVIAGCSSGESRAGFELFPSFDGMNIRSLRSDSKGVVAEVEDLSVRGEGFYDLRCGGEVVGYGSFTQSGALRVESESFARGDFSSDCVFQVYRHTFGVQTAYDLWPFSRLDSSGLWQWERHRGGVSLIRPFLGQSALGVFSAEIERWREGEFRQLTRILWGGLLASLLLWLAMVLLVLRSGSGDRLSQGVALSEDPLVAGGGAVVADKVSATFGLLFLGWVPLVVMYGGFAFLLHLMGL